LTPVFWRGTLHHLCHFDRVVLKRALLAPAVRSGTDRQPTARYLSQHGIHPFFLAAFLSQPDTFNRSGGPSQKFFSFFSPIVACTICALCGARNAYRCSNAASVLFCSHRRPDGERLGKKRRTGGQGKASCTERCCLLIRSLSETLDEQGSRSVLPEILHDCASIAASSCQHGWRNATCNIASR